MAFTTTSEPPSSAARTVSAALVAVIVLVVAGVSVGATAAYFELYPPAKSNPNSSPLNRSVTVTDDLGRSVTVPWNASRVVVLGPNIVDTMFRLGLRSHIVGVDCSSASFGGLLGDYTSNQTSDWSLSSSMCVEAFPAPVTSQILNLTPSLVLASSLVSTSVLEQFQTSTGIPFVELAPQTLGGIVYDVGLVAQIFPTGTRAAGLIGDLQGTIADLGAFDTNLSSNGTPLRSVLLTYYVTPASSPYAGYSTYGPTAFGDSLISLAGGASISASASTPYPTLTGSEVLAADPQVIVAGVGFGIDSGSYAQGPDWSSFPAVQNGNVTFVDSTLVTEADPSMVLWLSTFAHLLYPTLPAP